MMDLKTFAIPFGVLIMGLWVWLLWAHPKTLMMAFLVTGVVVIAFYRNEDITEMAVEPRRVLLRMEKIRKEIFAKADEMRALADYVGKLAVFSASHTGRFPPENLHAILLKQRDELAQMLRGARIAEERIREIISPITEMIVNDLANLAAFRAWTSATGLRGSQQETVADLTKRLKDSTPGQALSTLKPHLEHLGAWNDETRMSIKVFDDFRATGRLADDKPTAPGGMGTLR
jgi:hypothetical protein